MLYLVNPHLQARFSFIFYGNEKSTPLHEMTWNFRLKQMDGWTPKFNL